MKPLLKILPFALPFAVLLLLFARADAPQPCPGADHPVAAAAAAQLAAPTDRAAVRRLYDLQPGECVELALDFRSTTTVRAVGDAPPQAVTIAFAGTCTLQCLARRGGEWLAELRVDAEPRLDANGRAGDATRLAADLRQPLLLRVGEGGELLGYRFAPGVGAEHRNVLRSLCTALRAPAPGFRGREGDAGGIAELAVEPVGEHEARWTRRGYAPRSDGRAVPQLRGEGSASLGGGPWWTATRYDATQELQVPEAKFTLTQTLHAGSRLVDLRTAPLADHADPWSLAFAAAAGDAEGEQAMAATERERWQRELAGVGYRDVVAELARLLALGDDATADAYAQRERLVWLLRLQPPAAADLAAQLLDPQLDAALAAMLAGAAGSAATPALQQLLLDAAAAPDLSRGRRNGALVALSQVEQPQPATVRSLLALADAPDGDRILRGTSLLVLGAMASRSAADPDLLPQLLQREAAAGQAGLLRSWLGALGNAGGDAVLAPVRRHLDDDDDAIRAAAVDALRRAGESALPLLLQHARSDTSPLVRSRAIAGLANRPGDAAFAALGEALADADELVRRAAVLALANRREEAARELLQRASSIDPAAAVRRLAAQLLQT